MNELIFYKARAVFFLRLGVGARQATSRAPVFSPSSQTPGVPEGWSSDGNNYSGNANDIFPYSPHRSTTPIQPSKYFPGYGKGEKSSSRGFCRAKEM